MSMKDCLFCPNQLSGSEPPEHIIPQALLSNSNIDVTIKNVCSACNHEFGRTIDSEFINSTHIRYLVFRHAQYFTDNKINGKPPIKEKYKFITPNGEKLKVYRIIDENGIRIEPKPGPQQFLGKTIYFDNTNKVIDKNNLQRHTSIESIEFSIENPEELNKLEANVKFSRFICKVALEYIFYNYSNVAYSSKYDEMRQFVKGKIDKLPEWQKARITDIDINPLNPHYRFSKHDEHTIGIFLQNNQWVFMLSVFNVTSFYLMIPEDINYKEQFHIVKIKKS